jgi:hypothetical protein
MGICYPCLLLFWRVDSAPQQLWWLVQIWWWVSAPLFAVGFVVAWIGVGLDNLRIMLAGILLCCSLLVGCYAFLGIIVVAALPATAMTLFRVAREMVWRTRKRLARSKQFQSAGVWDGELDI